jgi:3-deoxy-manno-octulosonate cytidylyltransferase (CMP-KDO synthetase)
MKIAALIPARLGATRFPNKMLADIRGKSVIQRTYLSAFNSNLFDEVIVVTDSDLIMEHIQQINGKVIKSVGVHESGTDRIAEALPYIDADIIVNIQGDEPFVQTQPLRQLIALFLEDESVQVASLVQILNDDASINDPNYVKVVLSNTNNALYFSRSPIPYNRDRAVSFDYYEHIGVYGFRRNALQAFVSWEPTLLERIEKIECLRFLEHNVSIKMAITDYMGVEIDTPEDIIKAENLMDAKGWQ